MRKKERQLSTWSDIGQPDLRKLDSVRMLPEPAMIKAGATAEAALNALEQHLGFATAEMTRISLETPLGVVFIDRALLPHIVEKRQDARERFVHHAIATMQDPFEIWLVEYADDAGNEEVRHAFIGAFEGGKHMLVVFADANGQTLWNFMHGDGKALNKHRHGLCIYVRR